MELFCFSREKSSKTLGKNLFLPYRVYVASPATTVPSLATTVPSPATTVPSPAT
jgi:hypothetical protein